MFDEEKDMTDDGFENFLSGGDEGRGALFHWNLLDSYDMVCEILDDIFTSLNELIASLKEPTTTRFPGDVTGEYADAAYIGELYRLSYKGVACSVAAVGAIAPLVETLKAGAEKKWGGCPRQGSSNRSESNTKKDRTKNGFVPGFKRLLGSSAIGHGMLPDSLWNRLDALFDYRNAALHRGYEWPQDAAVQFKAMIEKNGWDDWFRVGSKGETPWIISMTDSFIKDVLEDVK